ncbi:MAG: hypothetical protein EA397_05315 [Deltaproteobacteria bacterium]|nr:MAG: hypothetical protein EA397_05315 [Deltaproteobacteria bacterium]
MSIAEPPSVPDPLEVIWRATARRLGLRIVRRPDVFASYDGCGTLALAQDPALDPDDHLGQMILHEICHWIVNGAESYHQIDWGFAPTEELDWRERPTLRLQLALCAPLRLARLMAPTTDARAYWDRVAHPLEPLDDSSEEHKIVARTRLAISRTAGPPWSPALGQALRATAQLHALASPLAGRRCIWSPSPPTGASP